MLSMTGLRTFVAVVETGGIRAAAERLHRTPSAISMTLKQLEKEIGGALFASERKSTLSDLGDRVLDEAQALLAHYDRTSAALHAFVANRVGRCDIASVPSVATTILPQAIVALRRGAPWMDISVRDMDSAGIVDAVEDGAVEIGFGVLHQPRPGLMFEPMLRDRLDLVCRADHPLAEGAEPIAWRQIAPREFITNGSIGLPRLVEAGTLARRSHLEARNVTSILAMVRAGLGVSVLPRLCRTAGDAQIRFLPLEDPAAERTLGCIVAAERLLQPATERLLDAVRAVMAQRADELGYAIAFTAGATTAA
ncbi:LysR family transcriptional regulator [Labrys wisconsinensis]|uniref:DNA-binding transcriptional LysR family regulator n=1 Tax=Labrys wisconsinensis TaxID=425677 RepID=A0ABU0J4M7_9HYPH|nr:LysR family transcriptional regulator [Labrys wisconsinensis]MDQ0469227.1 DNA-binding transcriptional LysR family regulator [Labrys wisconsinensis]